MVKKQRHNYGSVVAALDPDRRFLKHQADRTASARTFGQTSTEFQSQIERMKAIAFQLLPLVQIIPKGAHQTVVSQGLGAAIEENLKRTDCCTGEVTTWVRSKLINLRNKG